MSPSILIAEDDKWVSKVFQALVADSGAEVTVVADGHQALFHASRRSYDLVILDAVMPNLDGFETCRMIKTSTSPLCPRIIIVTALRGDAVDRAREAGADDFLPKTSPRFLLRARLLHHLHPPLRRSGPVLVLSPHPQVRSFLEVQLKKGGVPFVAFQELPDLAGIGEGFALVVVDSAFGLEALEPFLASLPSHVPRVLLYTKEDVPDLEQTFLPISDAFLVPLSGPEVRARIAPFLPSEPSSTPRQ